jgi:hypothetical protein
MVNFFERCNQEGDYWMTVSNAGLQRIYSRWVKETPNPSQEVSKGL